MLEDLYRRLSRENLDREPLRLLQIHQMLKNELNIILNNATDADHLISLLKDAEFRIVNQEYHLIVEGFIPSSIAPELDSWPQFFLSATGFIFYKKDEEVETEDVNWEKEGF